MEPQVEARQSKVTARWTFLSLHLYLSLKCREAGPKAATDGQVSFKTETDSCSDFYAYLVTMFIC